MSRGVRKGACVLVCVYVCMITISPYRLRSWLRLNDDKQHNFLMCVLRGICFLFFVFCFLFFYALTAPLTRSDMAPEVMMHEADGYTDKSDLYVSIFSLSSLISVCMLVSMGLCVFVLVCICLCVYVLARVCVACGCACVHVLRMYVRVCVYVLVCVCACARMCCVCMYLRVDVLVYVFVYVRVQNVRLSLISISFFSPLVALATVISHFLCDIHQFFTLHFFTC